MPLPASTLDLVLTTQLAVAFAGEGGEEPRFGWWRTMLVHEYGGLALLQDLAPRTFRWAALQAAREAARRVDACGDGVISLFHLGHRVDEQVDERLADHKRGDLPPATALPGLRPLLTEPWSPALLTLAPAPAFTVTPTGRRLPGPPPDAVEAQVHALAAALHPFPAAWPRPHYRLA